MKKIFVALVLSLIVVSCGNKNENGKENLKNANFSKNQNKETLTAKLPLVISGQKGIISEKDLIIPNMRGMMMARSKSLIIKEANSHEYFPISFNKIPEREKVKYINPDNLDELIQILHKEKKLI